MSLVDWPRRTFGAKKQEPKDGGGLGKALLAVALGLFTLAGAWVDLRDVPLALRLGVVAGGYAAVTLMLANAASAVRGPILRVLLSVAFIDASLAAVWLLPATARFHSLHESRVATEAVDVYTLTAPRVLVDTVNVHLPPDTAAACNIRSLTKSHPAQGVMLDIRIRMPRFRIDDFIHPQRVRIRCPAGSAGAIYLRVKPAATSVIDDALLGEVRLFSWIFGGSLCVLSLLVLWRPRSRRRWPSSI